MQIGDRPRRVCFCDCSTSALLLIQIKNVCALLLWKRRPILNNKYYARYNSKQNCTFYVPEKRWERKSFVLICLGNLKLFTVKHCIYNQNFIMVQSIIFLNQIKDYHLTISATKLTLNCSIVSPLSVNMVLNWSLEPTSANSLGGLNWNVTGTFVHDSTEPCRSKMLSELFVNEIAKKWLLNSFYL